ncbi:MAG: hypothetical protein KF805_10575 [Phycisphaeraceae bacterium]|nr:hypothetical protein [Phycisphaeraceae bacterium]
MPAHTASSVSASPAPAGQSGVARTFPGAEKTISEVFVSPRVVDRRTFEEYSLTLQQLIREASGHGRTLEVTSTEVRTLRETVQSLTRDLQIRLDAAGKVLPSLEQRIARAEQTADSVARLTSDPSRLEGLIKDNLAGLVRNQATEFEFACERTVQLAHARITEREELLARATAEFERLFETKRAELDRAQTDAMQSIESRAASVEAIVRRRLDEMTEQASEIERRAQARHADATARESLILEREAAVQRQLDDMVRGMEDRLAPLHEQVEHDVRELDKRIRRARLEVEVASGPGMQRLEQLCRAAANLLGPHHAAEVGLPVAQTADSQSTSGKSLADIVEDASRIHERLIAKAGEFGTLEQQVDIARRGMDKAILEGADKIDALFKQTDELVDTIGKSKDAAREIERIVEGRIDQLRADSQAFHDYTTRLGEHLLRLNENAQSLAAELGVKFGPDGKPAALSEPLLQQSMQAAEQLRDLLDKAGATIRALDHVAKNATTQHPKMAG